MYLRLNHELRRVVAEFVAERTGLDIDRDPYPLLVASAAVATCDINIHVWAASNGCRDPNELRREIFDTLTAGLTPRERRDARGSPDVN
jgi:hypothetical protein